MQYANIIVNHRAGYDAFSYAIPAEFLAYVQIGSVVMVPIGPQKVHGVVASFVRRVDSEVATKLKPIHSVIHPGEFIPEYMIKSAQSLQEKYGYSLADTLFAFLPNFLKKRQPDIMSSVATTVEYSATELIVPLPARPDVIEKLFARVKKSGQSLLIIFQNKPAMEVFAEQLTRKNLPTTIFPGSEAQKARREAFISGLTPNQPQIILGTRGAIMQPLNHVGAVVIDEPWLPGHKEDNTPKLWSIFAMQHACRARGISLYAMSALSWPETRLVANKRYTLKSPAEIQLRLIPRRPIREVVAQFVGSCVESGKKYAVFIREQQNDILWCPRCRKILTYEKCVKCGTSGMLLPRLTKETIAEELQFHGVLAQFSLFSTDEIEQFTSFDGALAVGFDIYLSIVDFRSPLYHRSLITLLTQQAKEVHLVTSHLDEWTEITHLDTQEFLAKEMANRKAYGLPPFSLAVQLASENKELLEKIEFEEKTVLRKGKIRKSREVYCLSLLLRNGSLIPEAWHKKQGLKVDILPNYVE